MGKIIYITDLDGTLLQSDKTISNYSIVEINDLISKGLNFSIATARSLDSAKNIAKSINLKHPVGLMNGVGIYDFSKKNFISVESIKKTSLEKVIEITRKYNVYGFIYTFEDERILRYYEEFLDNDAIREFCEERKTKYGIVYNQVDNLNEVVNLKKTVYYNTLDKYDKLVSVVDELKKIDNIKFAFYRDVYLEDFWLLEVFSEGATKLNVARYFREVLNFDKIIGFGDNDNDLDLLEGCDEFYAVSNAVDILKNRADGVIDSNNSDGVIRYILNRENN